NNNNNNNNNNESNNNNKDNSNDNENTTQQYHTMLKKNTMKHHDLNVITTMSPVDERLDDVDPAITSIGHQPSLELVMISDAHGPVEMDSKGTFESKETSPNQQNLDAVGGVVHSTLHSSDSFHTDVSDSDHELK
ncbi:hypothetical protein RFI_26066, partial [Reticulomyxa filosa]